MKKLFLSAAAVTLLFASCKKDDDGGSSLNRKDQLMTGKWKITAATVTSTISGVSTTQDIFGLTDECNKDDLSIFKSDMHLITDAGAVKCNSNDPQQEDAGTWALTDNDTKLAITESGSTESSNIDQLDGSTLKISNTETMTQGGFTVTNKSSITFTHVN